MIKQKFISKIVLVTTLLLLFPIIQPLPSEAAGASLYLSPSSSTKYTGDRFNLFVYASASQAVNTFDVALSSNNLTITGISSGGSICILFPNPPNYTSTTARFKCGLPTPGFSGSKGYIGAISVQAGSPGTGKVSVVSPSSVLANDGAGTNVLSSKGSATFTILPRPTSAPTITSSTHPNQDSWYKSNSAKLNWSGSGNNFSYLLDQSSGTDVDQISEGSSTSKTYSDLGDGIWYFHVRVQGSNGAWSATAHFRLQIDKTPPEKFTPEADPKVNAEKRPIVAFNTTDKTSGIARYELRIDKDNWATVANPYQIPKISSGAHKIEVKAVDKAGNETIASVEITVKNIVSPTILEPQNNSTLAYSDKLIIKGRSLPNYSVKIFLDGKEIATVKADKNGNFTYTYKELLKAGKHDLYAVALNTDRIESPRSKITNFTIDPKAYIFLGTTVPGMFLLITFLFVIIIFTLFIFFILFGSKRYRKKIKQILEDLEEKVEEDLEDDKVSKKTLEKIEEEFEEAEKEIK